MELDFKKAPKTTFRDLAIGDTFVTDRVARGEHVLIRIEQDYGLGGLEEGFGYAVDLINGALYEFEDEPVTRVKVTAKAEVE